ncbi:Pkinase-domain-containing protein [Xylariomycetidae sp. FL0641]|nr:Pkinase-domain-containing protein [Xylariomycetidae sp. FL0641]
MSDDADTGPVPIMPRRPAAATSPVPNHHYHDHHRHHRHPHHRAAVSPARDDAMTRDRTRDHHDDGSRDRDRPRADHEHDHDRRVSANNARSALRSPSPSHRQPHTHRGRDRGAREDRSARDDRPYESSRRSRPDASYHDRSHDRARERRDDARDPQDRHSRPEPVDLIRRHDRPSSPRRGARADDHGEPSARSRSFSPSSRKRRRSRSPLPLPPSRPKKSRRERDRDRRRRDEPPERPDRGPPKAPSFGHPRFERVHSPSRRSLSPGYDEPRSRYSDRPDLIDPPRHRRRSRSPLREPSFERDVPPPRARGEPKTRDRTRSPHPSSRRSSFSRTHSPPRSLARHPPGPSDGGSHSRRSSSLDPPRADIPPRSPRDRSARRSRGDAIIREPVSFQSDGPPGTGANSIEVNLARRVGDRRGSFGGPKSPMHSTKPHHDYRHPRSPRHGRSGSFHGSPGPVSPYGDSKSGRGGQRQSSPQDPVPPTGPSRNNAFSRGAFRGGGSSTRGGFRDRVASRSSQWNGPTSSNRTQRSPSGADNTRQPSPQRSGSHQSENATPRDSGKEENSSRSKDQAAEDDSRGKAKNEQPPTSRPPPSAPTGPASSKFSFAFKATNKAPVATPKPEISQKFSAAPKKEPQPADDRDRDLPRDTPREPASARARTDNHHHHQSRPPAPEPPRMRKVKKVIQKLKPKPKLDPELANSESVFFRKPGNESVVGSGTYGKVFKGVHVYTQELVALKRIRMEGERDGFPVTAVREIKLLQSLRHTNIVNLLEVMVEKNDCFMVFEYLAHDLTGLLNHPSYKLDDAQKKHLAKQLFEGLDYLHVRGVLHRDIKAANILVSKDGILKLADFGLARFYAKHHQLDYTNRVITIWYRSPELLLGETKYTAAVDIWSAACVMVEIFTRHAIFPGDGGEISQLEKVYQVLGTPSTNDWARLRDMPWFELLRPGYRRKNVFAEKYKQRVPSAAFDLLADMFQYDPAKRPNAATVLEHAYFTTEHPPPRQAIELADIQGDWHEFESKALRREKEKQEKQDREARKAAASKESGQREKEKKRPPPSAEAPREPKRPHVEGQQPALDKDKSTNVVPVPEDSGSRMVVD